MVLRYSGKLPHMVTPKEEFCCDSNCPSWKAIRICSHTVAVAEINKKLQQFLSSRKRKKGVNFTKLLTTSMPKGHGRKGVAPRVCKPSQPIYNQNWDEYCLRYSFVNAAPPTVTCHAHEGGSVFMPGFQHGTVACAASTYEFLRNLYCTSYVLTLSPRSSPRGR